jgi:hypothetical protein
MSSFIKMVYQSRTNKYLNLNLSENLEATVTHSGMGLEIFGQAPLVSMSGNSAGQLLETPVIRSPQKVKVVLGTIRPWKYHTFLEINPLLGEMGTVGAPRILEPDELYDLYFTFRADSQIDFSKDLSWLLRLYLID